jgi:hypothetical protein
MSLKDAAHKLHKQLSIKPWFAMLGEGKDKIIVYTKKKIKQDIFEFEGFEVIYRYMGKVKPAGTS